MDAINARVSLSQLAGMSVAEGVASLLASPPLPSREQAIAAFVAVAADHLQVARVRCQALGAAVSLAAQSAPDGVPGELPSDALYALEDAAVIEEASRGGAGWILTSALAAMPADAVSNAHCGAVAATLAAAGQEGPHIAALFAQAGDPVAAAAHLARVLTDARRSGDGQAARYRATVILAAKWARIWPAEALAILAAAVAGDGEPLDLADADILDPEGAARLRGAIASSRAPARD